MPTGRQRHGICLHDARWNLDGLLAFAIHPGSCTRSGNGDAAALRAVIARTRAIHGLGISKIWVVEHRGCAFGPGGIMLPNHQPLAVAEQVWTSDQLHPGARSNRTGSWLEGRRAGGPPNPEVAAGEFRR